MYFMLNSFVLVTLDFSEMKICILTEIFLNVFPMILVLCYNFFLLL